MSSYIYKMTALFVPLKPTTYNLIIAYKNCDWILHVIAVLDDVQKKCDMLRK
ncbi:hypothetical protein [Fibrobacter sp.]|uniref:hypothetical protein n=1 Tax=Fibrobacter sp. TaxID=35828 RepID=UPI0025B8C5A6|nr:hypothetical protein [Fibrobacter sp.]MBR3073242.1 hypothetical protein [Fibrobacter sp.]